MTPEAIEKAAESLFAAERERRQIGLLSVAHPEMTLDDAYAVQAALVARKVAAGGVIRGWKIGLTSRAMQAALGIETPDSGVLFEDMFFNSGAQIPRDRFIETRVEAEIAFVLGRDLSGAVSRDAVMAATQAVVPALEILDTRILRKDPVSGVARSIVDTVSDNAANAGIVLGRGHAPDAFDLRWVGAIVSKNGVVEETGLGAGVLNDPATGIAWLSERLARYGMGLKAGEVVLSGSFIRPIEARPGDLIEADYGAFGAVVARF